MDLFKIAAKTLIFILSGFMAGGTALILGIMIFEDKPAVLQATIGAIIGIVAGLYIAYLLTHST